MSSDLRSSHYHSPCRRNQTDPAESLAIASRSCLPCSSYGETKNTPLGWHIAISARRVWSIRIAAV